MFSPEYETQKRIFVEGQAELDRLLGEHLKYHETKQRREVAFCILASGMVVSLLLVVWLTVLGRLRHWRAVLLRSFDQLTHADEELRNAHSLLEGRVEERTAELRKASLEVQASEVRMRAITDSAQDAILMMDPDGKITYWNPAAARIFRYTSAEALDRNLHELIVPVRFRPAHHAAFPVFLQTGRGAAIGKTLDLEACRKDGREISVQLSLSAVQINGDWHAVGIIRDITERKRAEEALRQTEERLRLAQNAAHVGIWDFDLKTRRAVWAVEQEALFGFAPGTYDGDPDTFERLIHPEDRPRVDETLARALETGSYEMEFRAIRRDGALRWFAGCGRTYRDAAGQPARLIGINLDITARKQAELEIQHQAAFARFNPNPVLELSDAGEIIYFNNAAAEMARGLGRENPAQMLPPNTTAMVRECLAAGESKLRVETEIGSRVISWSFFPVKVNNTVHCYAGDITARKVAAAQLLETNRQLEAATARANELAARAELASRAKSEFLASMSHEIRTPMNGVMGMLGLLHDTDLSDRQREFIQIARSSAESLLGVINDILDFSKIEAGKFTLEPVPFDLQTVVEEVGEILAAKVADKGLDLIVRFAPNAPRYVIGDPGRVRQVLTNLVGNAVKFTAAGHVFISIQCERRLEKQVQLKFSVEDTGIGIAADKLDSIFEKFTQADASTTRRFGGTGLGLAISKQLVELMGGNITVTSQPGKGSTFSFTLPFDLSSEPLPAPPPRTLLEGVRVLIVDDNEVNRRVLHEQISSWRMRNGGYASGEEALTKLREARVAGDPYHIAILDYQMPGMDGEMLARAIKADPQLRATLLIMLSSLGHPDATKRFKEAGIFACLLKPVRQSKLWDVLVEAWGTHTRQSPAQLPMRPVPARPVPAGKTDRKVHARVLVVDDNTTNQKVARMMLENFGCRVDVSASGKEALEMLELLPYDVVFMDCEMPEMDGYETTAEIRRRYAGDRHVPIVAMTAKAIQGDRERCLEAGMDDYISKPVRLEDLEAALARWVPGDGNVIVSGQKSALPAAAPEASAPALDPAATARLRKLAAATDPSVLQEIYEAFLSSAVDYLAAIREGAAANDAEALRQAAHAFKGAGANIGAQKLAELCGQLEALGETGRVDGAIKCLEQLRLEFEQVKIEIENQTNKEAVI